jgi:hypothetical protein
MEPVFTTIPNGVGEIGLKVALAFKQAVQRRWLGFKAGKGTEFLVQHLFVGRRPVDRVCADIDYGGQPFRLQYLSECVGTCGLWGFGSWVHMDSRLRSMDDTPMIYIDGAMLATWWRRTKSIF